MKHLIASFHNGNLPPEMLDAQRRVFDHYGIPLLQWGTNLPHGEAMDDCLSKNEWDSAALFDADAFCRDAKQLEVWLKLAAETPGFGIIGGAHTHGGWLDYASPACCVVSRKAYEDAGTGFKVEDRDGGFLDVGQRLSEELIRIGRTVTLLPVVSVREPKWRLLSGGIYGNGTDYGVFYHEFESRFGEGPSKHFVEQVDLELQKPIS